jgi:hypothetical protein
VAKRPTQTSTEWHHRLRGLALLLPVFSAPDTDPDIAINALSDVAHRLGWVSTDFDWSSWARGVECQKLVKDPATVASADPMTLARLLTSHLRQDGFCEGHLLVAFEDGHLTAIVRRAVGRSLELRLYSVQRGRSRRRTGILAVPRTPWRSAAASHSAPETCDQSPGPSRVLPRLTGASSTVTPPTLQILVRND